MTMYIWYTFTQNIHNKHVLTTALHNNTGKWPINSIKLNFVVLKEPDWEAMAQHAEENQVKAKQRYREALKELSSQRHKDREEHNR